METQRDVAARMLNAHFSNNGLQYLIEEAGAALGNPIVVVDPSFHDIAHHVPLADDDHSRAADMLRCQVESGVPPEEGIDYIRTHRGQSHLHKMSSPLLTHIDAIGCDVLLGTAVVRGICLAHVMMVDYAHPFADGDEEAFGMLVEFIAQELQKTEPYVVNRGEAKSHFLVDLLTSHEPSRQLIEQRLKLIDFRPKARFLLVVMRPRQVESGAAPIRAIADALQSALVGAIYAQYEGQFVVLFTRDADEGIGERAERLIRQCAKSNDLAVGVSNYVASLTDAGRAYREATAAIYRGEIATPTVSDDSVYLYRNYAYMEMLDVCKRSADLHDYVHPSLLRLLAHDREHDTELMDTLFAYLQNACNTRRTADSLNVHKNTLLYRLGRIREILDCSLVSGEDIFMLQLSFRALMHLGMFYSRVSLNREELAQP